MRWPTSRRLRLDLADKLSVQPIVESKYVRSRILLQRPGGLRDHRQGTGRAGLEDQGDVKSTSLRIRTQDLNLTKSTLTLKKQSPSRTTSPSSSSNLNSQGISTNAGMLSSRSHGDVRIIRRSSSEGQRDYNQANAKSEADSRRNWTAAKIPLKLKSKFAKTIACKACASRWMGCKPPSARSPLAPTIRAISKISSSWSAFRSSWPTPRPNAAWRFALSLKAELEQEKNAAEESAGCDQPEDQRE